jgi:penicillin-binding protein 1A
MPNRIAEAGRSASDSRACSDEAAIHAQQNQPIILINEDNTRRRRILRICLRIAGHFRPLIDPRASVAVRVRTLIKALIASTALGIALVVAYAIALIPFTPGIADIRKAKAETPSILMSSDGKELAVFRRMNRAWVELDRISPHVVNALIATEDHRFHQHYGVDLRRTAAGMLRTLQGHPEGGSTLTQQLARNLYPEQIGRKRTITRKLKELITALKIEYAYSKQEILLTYLNTMPFLYNAFGIEMGARTYFDKSAADLNVLESATLIGMLKGTSYYNPVFNRERAQKRRNVVLSQMVKRGVLDKAEFDRLKKRPIRLDFARQPEPIGTAPHFTVHLHKWLIDWADRNDYNLYSDGLVIHSTIDSRLQKFAEQAVRRQMAVLQAVSDAEKGINPGRRLVAGQYAHLDARRHGDAFGAFGKARSMLLDAFVRESADYRAAVRAGAEPGPALRQLRQNAAFMARLSADKMRMETGFVAIDPANGHVRAWVGSRDFTIDQFDHVAQARRQPGSTFKPFVYGAALEAGIGPQTMFADQAIDIPLANGSVWRPSDRGGPSGRQMSLREALAHSKNTIAAQVMQEVGPEKVVGFARRLGVQHSQLDPVPALSLGTSPVTLLEMASAYGTIASGGEYRKPALVTHIADKEGRVLASFVSDPTPVISGKTAYDLTDMMRSVIDQGTGRAIRSRFGVRGDVAGKTGTTQENADGWFMLMHPRLVAGAWVGFNDARVAIQSSYWGQGGKNALPIVGDFYRHALQARIIDGAARFAPPPASWLESLKGRLQSLLDWPATTPEPEMSPARRSTAPRPPDAAADPAMRLHELERNLTQALEAEPSTDARADDEDAPHRLMDAIEATAHEAAPGSADATAGAADEAERDPVPAD